MADSPEIPRSKAELNQDLAVYADLVALYPQNEGYLQQYAELLMADNKLTTATEALKQLHDLIAKRSPEQAAAFARKYPQIGRVSHSPGRGDIQELGREIRKEFGILWIKMHQESLIEGQNLYHRGDQGETLYLILKGAVATSLQMENGRHSIVDIIESDDVVGEDTFLSPGPHLTNVVANCKTTYVELPRKRLLSWLLDNPDIERLLEAKAEFRQMLRLISANPLLQPAPLDMRKYMAEQSNLVSYPAGSLIHRAGEDLAYVDMLVHGQAQLAVRPHSDKPDFLPLEKISVGEVIGDTSAVRKAKCPADIMAISDVVMAHIPLAAVTNVVSAYPPLREKLIAHADRQQRHIMRQILSTGGRSKA